MDDTTGKIVDLVEVDSQSMPKHTTANIVELGEDPVTPGYFDAHIHAIASGIKELYGCSMLGETTWDGGKARLDTYLHERVEATDAPWLVGSGWHRNWFDGKMPSCALLDTVSASRFIYLRDRSGHTVWLNTPAMVRFNEHFGQQVEQWAAEGLVENGCLREQASDAAIQLLPKLTVDQRIAAIHHVQRKLLASGIVGYQEAGLFPGDPEAYASLYASQFPRRQPMMHVRGLQRIEPGGDIPNRLRELDAVCSTAQGTKDFLKFDGVKVFVDGSAANGSAVMLPRQSEEYRGKANGALIWPPDQLEEVLSRLPESMVAHFHVIGDGAVAEAIRRSHRNPALELQLAHVFFAPPAASDDCPDGFKKAEMERFRASYSVFSPMWFHNWNPNYEECYGAAREKEMFPWWQVHPEYVVFGSDFPVTTFDPQQGVESAIRYGMPRTQAMYAATMGAARACGMGANCGSFAVSKYANFHSPKGTWLQGRKAM